MYGSNDRTVTIIMVTTNDVSTEVQTISLIILNNNDENNMSKQMWEESEIVLKGINRHFSLYQIHS